MLAELIAAIAKHGKNIRIMRTSVDDKLLLTISNGNVVGALKTDLRHAGMDEPILVSRPGDTLTGIKEASISAEGELFIDGEKVPLARPEDDLLESVYGTLRAFVLPSLEATDMVEEESEVAAWEAHLAAGTQFAQISELFNEPILKRTDKTAVMTLHVDGEGTYYAMTLRGCALVAPRPTLTSEERVAAHAAQDKAEKEAAKAAKAKTKAKPAPAVVTPEIMPEGDAGDGLVDDVLGGDPPAPAPAPELEAETETEIPAPAVEPVEPVADPNVCGNKLPDGRVCNKAKGHEGKHWYGGLGGAKSSPPKEKAGAVPPTGAVSGDAPACPATFPESVETSGAEKPATVEDLLGALEQELSGFTSKSKELLRRIKAAVKEQAKAKSALSEKDAEAIKQLKALVGRIGA